MIVAVTPNPALDVTIAIDALRRGSVHRAKGAARRAGGKGVNVARVLVEQGIEATAAVAIGGAIGDAVRADLERSGIPAALVPAARETRMTVALIDGETTNVNESGADPGADAWDALAGVVETLLTPGSVLVVSGSLPAGSDPESALRLLRLAAARGIPAIADLPGSLLGAAIDAGATHVKPNRAELAEATGIDDPIEAARALVDRGSAARGTAVLASLDIEGLLLVTADGVVAGCLDRPLEGNTTGAGDAAVAALAAALAQGETDPREIVRRCVLWSAAAVLHPLAGSIGDLSAGVERELAPRIRIRIPTEET